MTVALIISTYNWPEALRQVLLSVKRQTRLPDEIIIADDGSRDDTRLLVESMRSEFPVPLKHVWQPDEGFLLARIRNKAVAAAHSDYIIQIDGDIVIDRHFVADHAAVAKRGHYALGSRVRLTDDFTRSLFATDRFVAPAPWSRNILRYRNKAFRLPIIGRMLSHGYRNKGCAIGCNMAFYRADFIAVNGYEESFTTYGGEEKELDDRLRRSGFKRFKLFRIGVAWHLYHDERSNPREREVIEMLATREAACVKRADDGIDKYL